MASALMGHLRQGRPAWARPGGRCLMLPSPPRTADRLSPGVKRITHSSELFPRKLGYGRRAGRSLSRDRPARRGPGRPRRRSRRGRSSPRCRPAAR
ncbi:hypothetical protein E4099_16840 [Streptomyces palmae]|uniref:Uncharacterized protein n=1 Tax=Streptomyces palmae TaxID=1701085 RepID=A0A4Z0H7C3_9ACTN|nr:hypothetical protein E4099_16840 [Streptomyces palmae]